MSIILAGIIFTITCAWCVMLEWANGMSDAPSHDTDTLYWFIGGGILSGAILSTHWLGW